MERLVRALDRCADEGRPARFWLRDDDAVAPSAALDRLLAVMEGLPLTLAVIPAYSGADVGRAAGGRGGGDGRGAWLGASRTMRGRARNTQELGAHRPVGVVLDELDRGVPASGRAARGAVRAAAGAAVEPDRAGGGGGAGRDSGFRALSVFGPERPGPIRQVNTQVDVIDWRGTRGGRDEGVLVDEIVARIGTGGAVGLLTHHLVHDAAVVGVPSSGWWPRRAGIRGAAGWGWRR